MAFSTARRASSSVGAVAVQSGQCEALARNAPEARRSIVTVQLVATVASYSMSSPRS
jgi:hypothetical protein